MNSLTHEYIHTLTCSHIQTHPQINSHTSSQTHSCSHIALCINKLTYIHSHTCSHTWIHKHSLAQEHTYNSLPHSIATHMHMFTYLFTHNTFKYTNTLMHFSHTQACSHTLMYTLAHSSAHEYRHRFTHICEHDPIHPCTQLTHSFFIHTKTHIHSLTHRHIHMNSHKYAHAQHISCFGSHCSWVFIQKTLRKRVLHPLIFSLFWPDPFFSAHCEPGPSLSGWLALTMS